VSYDCASIAKGPSVSPMYTRRRRVQTSHVSRPKADAYTKSASSFGIAIGDAFLEAASCTTIRVSYISYNRRRGLVNRVSFMAQPKGVALGNPRLLSFS